MLYWDKFTHHEPNILGKKKKYDGTISISCLDENGKTFDIYNL